MLPRWVSSCDIDGQTIFLDIKRNRYSAMKSGVGRALIAGDYEAVPPPILDEVTALGWRGKAGDSRIFAPTQIEKPTIELAALSRGAHATAGLFLSALAAIFVARYQLRTMSLERLLQAVVDSNGRAAEMPKRAAIEDIVYAAEAVERIVLGSKACLLKSLALQRLLSRHGHASALVFGVHLNPFRAHCWLQQRNVILNDTIERIGMFTILRAVE